LPQSVAQDDDLIVSGLILTGQKGPSQGGRYTQQIEIACLYAQPFEPLRLTFSGKSEIVPLARNHILEGMALLPPGNKIMD